MKTPQSIHINRGNAVMVIVDVQNEFCKPGGKGLTPRRAQIMPGVISAIRGLSQRARGAGIPIIYVQSVRTLHEPEVTVFGKAPSLQAGSWGVEIVEELKPQPGDIVVQKFSHDPFYKTDLDRVLQSLVSDPTQCYAIVTGGGISVCHYHGVMGFYLRNYWTVVPLDCVHYMDDAANQRALEQFSLTAYPNIFLSRSDLIKVSKASGRTGPKPIPGH